MTGFTQATLADADGTCLQGSVETTYARLVAVFGPPPADSGGDKWRVEWVLRFDDGTVATVYDWKLFGTPVEDVTMWNVGGRSVAACRMVQAALSAPTSTGDTDVGNEKYGAALPDEQIDEIRRRIADPGAFGPRFTHQPADGGLPLCESGPQWGARMVAEYVATLFPERPAVRP